MTTLFDAKVGDILVRIRCPGTDTLVQVTGVTPTQVIIGQTRISKATGHPIGDTGWNVLKVRPPAEGEVAAIREEAERMRLLKALRLALTRDDIALRRLRAIHDVMFPPPEET